MIHFICALKCEARSLIAHYRLKHSTDSESFPLYISPDKQMTLTISGIGKINAAAATAFTHAFLYTEKQDIWLNLGIAGHKSLAIGEITLGHKIIDQANNYAWYPQIIFSPLCPSVEIISCDKPVTDYTDALFEMEAAGFYATACRFASGELIHVIKIISDNQQQPAEKMSESFVAGLVKEQLTVIDQIAESLSSLANELDNSNDAPDYYEQIIEQWRFTHAQKSILKSCLNRWHVLCPGKNPMKEIDKALHGKEVIYQITHKLDAYPIRF